MARWFMRPQWQYTVRCRLKRRIEGLEISSALSLSTHPKPWIDKKTNNKSLTLAESLEEPTADKPFMLTCQRCRSNFKQTVLVREQQDVFCNLDPPRRFPASLSGKMANAPQRKSPSERMWLECPQVKICLLISTADHCRLLGGPPHVCRLLLHKRNICCSKIMRWQFITPDISVISSEKVKKKRFEKKEKNAAFNQICHIFFLIGYNQRAHSKVSTGFRVPSASDAMNRWRSITEYWEGWRSGWCKTKHITWIWTEVHTCD